MELSLPEFIAMMQEQRNPNRSGYSDRHYWVQRGQYFAKSNSEFPKPFVLIPAFPLQRLALNPAATIVSELVKEYSSRKSAFPPIFAILPYPGLEISSGSLLVDNGAHRVSAARQRGDSEITIITDQKSWAAVKSKCL